MFSHQHLPHTDENKHPKDSQHHIFISQVLPYTWPVGFALPVAEIPLKLTLLHLGDLRSECGYSGISSTPSVNDLSHSRSLFLFCWMFAKTSAMTKNSMSYLFLLGLHCPRQLCWVSHKLIFWRLFFFFFWLGLKIPTLVFQLQSSLIIYKTYCLEFLRICYPSLRGGIHASQSSTLWSYAVGLTAESFLKTNPFYPTSPICFFPHSLIPSMVME